jgi:2-polyprenyl-3-methyl-5-hydroxy-6-metoxy-1,4-benzoquinol methylase
MERVDFRTAKNIKGDYESLIDHMWRYWYAMRFIRGKKVIDAACGTGYGSLMMGWGAETVTGLDINISHTRPSGLNVRFAQADFNKDTLPKADVCVSFETIEHLEEPGYFLKELRCKELVFSIPLDMPSQFHKRSYKEEDIKELLEDTGWNLIENDIQDHKYFYGRAIR